MSYKNSKQLTTQKNIGNYFEILAAEFLVKNGLELVEQQYLSKLGEIDLIMREFDELVFVEVRYRADDEFGEPFESITRKKCHNLILCAEQYLQSRQWTDFFTKRFDVISILGSTDNPKITWIIDAFGVE